MLAFSYAVFVLLMGALQSQRETQPDLELLQAISKTRNWIENIPTYEVEIQCKRYTEFDAASSATTRVEVIHELKGTNKTSIVRTAGVWQVDLGQAGSRDSLKTSFYVGEEGNATTWSKGYAKAFVECEKMNCLKASNFHVEHAAPLLTAMPLERQFEVNHLEEVINVIRQKPKQGR